MASFLGAFPHLFVALQVTSLETISFQEIIASEELTAIQVYFRSLMLVCYA